MRWTRNFPRTREHRATAAATARARDRWTRSLSGAWTQSRPRPHQALDIYFVAWLKRVSEHEMTENSRTPSDCDNHCEGER